METYKGETEDKGDFAILRFWDFALPATASAKARDFEIALPAIAGFILFKHIDT